jgi:sec-independent protein translocase protein TatB
MFNLGFGELLVICVILIIVVGPERLPTLMRNVGKGMRTMRDASREIRSTIGIDELLNEDVMQPKPPKVPPPSATISRTPAAQALSSTADAKTANDVLPVVSAAGDSASTPAAQPKGEGNRETS